MFLQNSSFVLNDALYTTEVTLNPEKICQYQGFVSTMALSLFKARF